MTPAAFARPAIGGIILCGGKSSRMGRDKGLIEFDGEPLILRSARLLRQHCQQLVISGQKTEYKSLGLKCLPDLYANAGPLGGIASCLRTTGFHWNMVLACDMPKISGALIDFLINHIKEPYRIVVPVHNEFAEPLCAAYHIDCESIISNQITQGVYSLHKLFQLVPTLRLDVTSAPFFRPDLFANLNTPDDLCR